MGNEFQGKAGHSAEHFGDTRDHWWNIDFLRLMAKRWKLDTVRSVLDVGCGVGHWGMLLASVMPEDVRITGIDREPSWVKYASERAAARGLDGRFSFREGEAERLPFPDNSFDLATCQTVLIHLCNPGAAIAEMLRVTKPGGLVAVAEPNNLTESLLPGLFAAQGLAEIEVHVNDKATAVFPPYSATEQRAFAEDARDRQARRLWHWSEADARRLYLAGGGSEESFVVHFALAMASREKIVRGLDDSTYHGIVGGEFYLVAGRKKGSQV